MYTIEDRHITYKRLDLPGPQTQVPLLDKHWALFLQSHFLRQPSPKVYKGHGLEHIGPSQPATHAQAPVHGWHLKKSWSSNILPYKVRIN